MVILTQDKADEYLKKYVKVANAKLFKHYSGVEKFSKNFKKIVLKIISKDALHKSNIGGVIISSKEKLSSDFDKLLDISKKNKLKLDGIYVQEFLEGTELIVGIKQDVTFGKIILLGVGGIFVELIEDVSIRVCPITKKDGYQMIDELKNKKILDGFRGSKKVNRNKLVELLVKLSTVVINSNIVEMDINPLICSKECVVADSRIVLN